MRSIIESIGGRPYKRYRVYERELDERGQSAPFGRPGGR